MEPALFRDCPVCLRREFIYPQETGGGAGRVHLPKDGKLVLRDWGSSPIANPFSPQPLPLLAITVIAPSPVPAPRQHHLCSPQQGTGSAALGWGVVEGRRVWRAASGVPTGVVHQAPVGTRGAADQLAPGRNGGGAETPRVRGMALSNKSQKIVLPRSLALLNTPHVLGLCPSRSLPPRVGTCGL